MSINPQHQAHDQFDVLMGSVSSHFAQIDNVLLQNECINGQYQLVTSASYSQNCPVTAPGFTRVCISTNGSIIADLENSYITAELEYTLSLNGLTTAELPFGKAFINAVTTADIPVNSLTKYFIGFKQSLDALSRYSIYVNSQEIYTQNFVGQESIVQYAGINDTILNNSPYTYTSYQNASTMNNNVCGVYIDLKDLPKNTSTFTVRIPIKLNLHQFLLLSPIHYLPSFAGRWEIELYFNANNLIICPVNPLAYCDQLIAPIINRALLDTDHEGDHWKGFTKNFTQIRDKFYVIVNAGQSGTGNEIYDNSDFKAQKFKLLYEQVSLQCSKAEVKQCLMNITQFQLKYEVYEALMSHYTENPLIIPINLLHYHRFTTTSTNTTENESSTMHATANLPIENCDSIFLLFPNNDTQTTCYYQPYLSNCRLSMGEFGVKPAQYVNTYNDPRFVGLTLDALNLEMSKISAMNKDFSNSIMPHTRIFDHNGAITYTVPLGNGFTQYDNSCFLYGLSCSQVGFQSGTMSSPTSNINFQFDANIDTIVELNKKKTFNVPMVAMFLQDAEIIIQVVPNSDHPVVRISSKSVV